MNWKTVDIKPNISGQYIVTRLDMTVRNNTKTYIDVGYYNKATDSWYSNRYNQVVAWMDTPEPFQVK